MTMGARFPEIPDEVLDRFPKLLQELEMYCLQAQAENARKMLTDLSPQQLKWFSQYASDELRLRQMAVAVIESCQGQ